MFPAHGPPEGRALSPSPDLAELRAFCIAADLGTLGRAAVRLRVSQPALSRRVRTLEEKVGVELLERSPQGVNLTPAGRRMYEHARGLLASADAVAEVMVGLRREAQRPVRLAASHSAEAGFVAELLATINERRALAVELATAVSQVVRSMVADGRADLGVAAGRPNATPNPGIRELELAPDAVVCAVPPGHRWAATGRVTARRFLATPMVMRDVQSNARWTVDAVLRARGLELAPPLAEAPTPGAALREARARGVPLLVSRQALAGTDFTPVEISGLAFPRAFELVLPAYGEPSGEVAELIARMRDHVRIWLR